MRELLKDVALKVEDSATNDSFRVMGRGEMHLSILIETMRREGYELQVSPPHVLTHEENGFLTLWRSDLQPVRTGRWRP